MELQNYITFLASFITLGFLLITGLIATTANAINGEMVSQHSDR